MASSKSLTLNDLQRHQRRPATPHGTRSDAVYTWDVTRKSARGGCVYNTRQTRTHGRGSDTPLCGWPRRNLDESRRCRRIRGGNVDPRGQGSASGTRKPRRRNNEPRGAGKARRCDGAFHAGGTHASACGALAGDPLRVNCVQLVTLYSLLYGAVGLRVIGSKSIL